MDQILELIAASSRSTFWLLVLVVVLAAFALASWLRVWQRLGLWMLSPSKCLDMASVDLGLPPKVIPGHIAVIMDGNRRYGRETFGVGGAIRGHRAGGETLSHCIRWCMDYGIQSLTAYAFSTENWNRDPSEVDTLMRIFAEFCPKIKRTCLQDDIRVKVLSSDFKRFPQHIQKLFTELEEVTKEHKKFNLYLCVSYGGRGEIALAAKQIAKKAVRGEIKVENINEVTLGQHLLTKGVPDPDFVLRTSGEYRLSNFLLWQVAYSEMIFVDKHWPQLDRNDFLAVLHEFSRRKRRFGK